MGKLTLVPMPLQIGAEHQNACAATGTFGAVDAAICQNMIRSGAKDNPDRFYRLQHLWADKWKAASARSRDFVAVDPAAAVASPEAAMNVAGINKLAATMLGKFRSVCEKACGATVYMALGHGGVNLVDKDEKALPGKRQKLQEEREALKRYKQETDNLDKKDPNYKANLATRKKHEAEERDRLDCEDARLNRAHFPTFSLGAQRGKLHSQYLAMSYEYFVYLDHPKGGWTDAERACFEARKAYFAELKTIFQDHQIKTLSLIACKIGEDSTFISRVGGELGVNIVSYAYFTLVEEVTGFMGLSSDEKTADIVPATSVDPPRSPVVTS